MKYNLCNRLCRIAVVMFIISGLSVINIFAYEDNINNNYVENVENKDINTNKYALNDKLVYDYKYEVGLNASIRDENIYVPINSSNISFNIPKNKGQIVGNTLYNVVSVDNTSYPRNEELSDNSKRILNKMNYDIDISDASLLKFEDASSVFRTSVGEYNTYKYLKIKILDFSKGFDLTSLLNMNKPDILELNPKLNGYKIETSKTMNGNMNNVYILPEVKNPGTLELLVGNTLVVTIDCAVDNVTPLTLISDTLNTKNTTDDTKVLAAFDNYVVDDALNTVSSTNTLSDVDGASNIEDLSGTGDVPSPVKDNKLTVNDEDNGFNSEDYPTFELIPVTDEQIESANNKGYQMTQDGVWVDPVLGEEVSQDVVFNDTSDNSQMEENINNYWDDVYDQYFGRDNPDMSSSVNNSNNSGITYVNGLNTNLGTSNTSGLFIPTQGSNMVAVPNDIYSQIGNLMKPEEPQKKELDTTGIDLDPMVWGVSDRTADKIVSKTTSTDELLKNVNNQLELNITDLSGKDHEFVQRTKAKIKTVQPIQPTIATPKKGSIFLGVLSVLLSFLISIFYVFVLNVYIRKVKKDLAMREVLAGGEVIIEDDDMDGFTLG